MQKSADRIPRAILNAAVDILRKKGAATAAKKATARSQGRRHCPEHSTRRQGGRVGRNQLRDRLRRPQRKLPRFLRRHRPASSAADPSMEALEADRVAAVAKIGENIKIPRFIRYEVSGNGLVAAYIHTGAKVGVLVEVGAGKEATVAREDFKQLVRDITLQIAAGNPSAVSREGIAADVDCQGKGNRRRTGQKQAPAGHRQDRRRQAGEVFPNLLPGRPGIRQTQLRSLGQGAHRLRRQAIGRRDYHPPLCPFPSRRIISEFIAKPRKAPCLPGLFYWRELLHQCPGDGNRRIPPNRHAN